MIERIAYLGPEGSYSHLAAQKISEGRAIVPLPDLAQVIRAARGATAAVVPIENSVEGAVNICLDMLIFESALYITRELTLDICHCLIAGKGASMSSITKVLTHPQAYAQCRGYIERNLPNAEVELTRSTSEAALAASATVAAIAGKHCIDGDLCVLSENIGDYAGNRTRFIMLEDKPVEDSDADKISIAFESGNYAGGLLSKLKILAKYNLNMIKIESRPHKSALGRYVFSVDFCGNIAETKVVAALNELRSDGLFYKYLGNY